jgi:hypothetical protein
MFRISWKSEKRLSRRCYVRDEQTYRQLPDPVSLSEKTNNLWRLPKIDSLFFTRMAHNLITIKTELPWNFFLNYDTVLLGGLESKHPKIMDNRLL